MNEFIIVIESVAGSKGRRYTAHFKHLQKKNPRTGYGVGGKPHEAVSALLAEQIGIILLQSGGAFGLRIEWADAEDKKRFEQRFKLDSL